MFDDFPGVRRALITYLDGLYHSDTSRLREVMHEKASYSSVQNEELIYHTMDEYFPIVDARPSPASRNEPRYDRILEIRFAGSNTAFASLNCAIGDKYFTDFLTLIRHEDRWQIIAKVFHVDPLPLDLTSTEGPN